MSIRLSGSLAGRFLSGRHYLLVNSISPKRLKEFLYNLAQMFLMTISRFDQVLVSVRLSGSLSGQILSGRQYLLVNSISPEHLKEFFYNLAQMFLMTIS